MEDESTDSSTNVLGEPLEGCCFEPMTGFFRDGFCRTSPQDLGLHAVCARMTDEFLSFSSAKGNDLSTPRPEYNFPGLKAGDKWCLCAARWEEARRAGCAPPVFLSATSRAALSVVNLENLKEHAADIN